MAEIISCPNCQRKVQVPDEFLGKRVRCPECKHPFVAESAAATGVQTAPAPRPSSAPTPPPASAPLPAPAKVPEWEKPKPYGQDKDDDEDDRPRKKKKKQSRYNDDEDDEDDVGRRRRRYLTPHRGGMVMSFGIISIATVVLGTLLGVCCLPFGTIGIVGLIFGPIAWVMGGSDLAQIDAGAMDPSGRGSTQAGRVMGIIGTALGILGILLAIGLFVLGVALNVQGRRF